MDTSLWSTERKSLHTNMPRDKLRWWTMAVPVDKSRGRVERTSPKWEMKSCLETQAYIPYSTMFHRTDPSLHLGRAEYFSEAIFTVIALLMCSFPVIILSKSSPLPSSRGALRSVPGPRLCSVPWTRPHSLGSGKTSACAVGQGPERQAPSQAGGSERVRSKLSAAGSPDTEWGLPTPALTEGLERGSFWKPCSQLNVSSLAFSLNLIPSWDVSLPDFLHIPTWLPPSSFLHSLPLLLFSSPIFFFAPYRTLYMANILPASSSPWTNVSLAVVNSRAQHSSKRRWAGPPSTPPVPLPDHCSSTIV